MIHKKEIKVETFMQKYRREQEELRIKREKREIIIHFVAFILGVVVAILIWKTFR